MSYKPNIFKRAFHASRRRAAKSWMKFQPATQIALTGSQGKTSITYVLAKLLASVGKTVRTDIKLDTIYNVPITALRVRPWHKFVVWELGVDHIDEMDKHLEIAHPKIAIISGISPVHTDAEHFGSLANLIKEKRKLIESLPPSGYAILNYDSKEARDMAPFTKAHVLYYGTNPNHCTVWAENIHLSFDGIKATFHDGEKSFNIQSSLIGEQQIYTLMAAYLAGKLLELPLQRYLKKIKEIKPLKGRMSIEEGPHGTVILNDSLRANPSSTASGLKTLDAISYSKGKKIALLAEMGELEFPEKEHKKIGELIAQLKIDILVGIGPLQKYVVESAVKNGFPTENAYAVSDVFEAAHVLKHIIKKGDLLYLKGSLLRHIERVILILKEIKVECTVVSCPFYYHCTKCKYLKTGYQNKLNPKKEK